MRIFIAAILLIFALKAYAVDDMQQAYQHYKNQDYKSALKILEQNNNKDASYYLLKYEILKKQNKLKEAQEALFAAASKDEGCYEAYIGLSIIAIENHDSKNAGIYLERALELSPELKDSPDFIFYLAKVCILNKDFSQAKNYLLKILEYDNDNCLASFELGKIYLYEGDYLKAANAFEFALSDSDIEADCYNYLGLTFFKRANYKRAEYYLNKALEKKPEELIFLNNLAQNYKMTNDIQNYNLTMEKIMNVPLKTPLDYFEMTNILYDKKMYSDALKIIKKGMNLYPNDVLLQRGYEKLNKS